MTDVLFSQTYDRIWVGSMTCAAISHHAIARLVEREAVSPEDLSACILLALEYCAGIAERILDTAVDYTVMQSFMLPFAHGALVAVFMDMDPAQVYKGQERRRILSVRTYLDEDKLSDADIERMGGLCDVVDDMKFDYETGSARFLRWIEGNARPWNFADSTLGDRVQG